MKKIYFLILTFFIVFGLIKISSVSSEVRAQTSSTVGQIFDTAVEAPETNLYYPLIQHGWPSNNPNTLQWSDLRLFNPNSAPATVSIQLEDISGKTTGDTNTTYNITIAQNSTYNSGGDPSWTNATVFMQDGTTRGLANLKIISDLPISGLIRWQLRAGTTSGGNLVQTNTIPLASNPTYRLYYPSILRNWPSNKTGNTQWSDVILFNTSINPVDVTFNLYSGVSDNNGALLSSFTKNIVANGYLNTSSLTEWSQMPVNNQSSGTLATLSISAPITAKLVGIHRLRLIDGQGNANGSSTATIDTPLLQSANKMYFPQVFKNWPSEKSGLTQWSDLILFNPNQDPVSIIISLNENGNSGNNTPSQQNLNIQIPANGYYNTYGTDWLNNLSREKVNANISLTVAGIYGIAAVERWRLVDGITAQSPIIHLSDVGILNSTSSKNTASAFLARGVPTVPESAFKQYTEIAVLNPQDSPNNISINIYSSKDPGNDLLKTIQYAIPPNSIFNSYNFQDWLGIPKNFSNPDFTLASFTISSEFPVYTTQRTRYSDQIPTGGCSKKPLGDADCSGIIDKADFEIWKQDYASRNTTDTLKADFNSDNLVDLKDFEIWRRNFNLAQ